MKYFLVLLMFFILSCNKRKTTDKTVQNLTTKRALKDYPFNNNDTLSSVINDFYNQTINKSRIGDINRDIYLLKFHSLKEASYEFIIIQTYYYENDSISNILRHKDKIFVLYGNVPKDFYERTKIPKNNDFSILENYMVKDSIIPMPFNPSFINIKVNDKIIILDQHF